MASLPFVVQPKLKPIIEQVGTEESGIIEIQRRGYLTAAEKAFVQQIQQQDGGTLQLVALSRRIAREKKIGIDKAYENVIKILTGEANSKLAAEIEADYAEDIQRAVNEIGASRAKEDIIYAACLVIHRIDDKFSLEEIVKLHPDLISGLANLYREEEVKSIDKLTQASGGDSESQSTNVEEIEKKPETPNAQ